MCLSYLDNFEKLFTIIYMNTDLQTKTKHVMGTEWRDSTKRKRKERESHSRPSSLVQILSREEGGDLDTSIVK